MTAITINDLDNAKVDVDHIAEIANSLESTATDRMGHTKLTVFGAMQTLVGLNWRGTWATATAYALKDGFTDGSLVYVTVQPHTSTSIAADLAAGKIVLYQGTMVKSTDRFVEGVDFSAGGTVLTLSRDPGSKDNIEVHFGADYQGPNQYNLAGTTLTFTAPFPAGLGEIFVTLGITQSALTPTPNSITDEMIADGTKLNNRINNYVDPWDFGLVDPTGVLDSSAAFAAAAATGKVIRPRWGIYRIKNIDITTHQTLEAEGAIFRAATGASYIFKMKEWRPIILNAYFDDQDDNIVHGIGTNAAVIVEDAAHHQIDMCGFTNVYSGLLLKVSINDTSHEVTKGKSTNLDFNTVTARGIFVGPNVNTQTFHNMRMYVGAVPSNGKLIPKAGCIGFQMVSTGSTLAFGGHKLSLIDVEEAETGYQFTDATLSEGISLIADSLSGNGYEFTGNCSDMTMANCFAGTALRGFSVSDASAVDIVSPKTRLMGVVPPWGDPANFFNAGAPFDIFAGNSAQARVSDWRGDDKFFADPTAAVTFNDAEFLHSASLGTVAAGGTTYFGPVGNTSADVSGWVMNKPGLLLGFRAQVNNSPGGIQTHTYNVMKNGVDTGVYGELLGGAFQVTGSGYVTHNAGDVYSLRCISSGSAALANHRIVIETVPLI